MTDGCHETFMFNLKKSWAKKSYMVLNTEQQENPCFRADTQFTKKSGKMPF